MWDSSSQARGTRSRNQSGFPGSSPQALSPCLDEHKQAWLFIVGEDTLEGDGTLPTQFSSKFLFFVQTLQVCVETGLTSELIQGTISQQPIRQKGDDIHSPHLQTRSWASQRGRGFKAAWRRGTLRKVCGVPLGGRVFKEIAHRKSIT